MNSLLSRSLFLLLHAVLNFLFITWLLDYDITGKWIRFIGFFVVVLALVYLFVNHIISYIYFLKTKTK